MARRWALAALPVLIGAAIEVSDLGGDVVSLVAWILVGLTLLVLLVHWLLGGAGGRPEPARWHRLGTELVAFVGKRRAERPPDDPPVRGWLGGRRRSEWRRSHEADTMTIYLEHFAERVADAIRDLRRHGLLGEAEAKLLASPTTPAGIERLGQRLMELSYQAP